MKKENKILIIVITSLLLIFLIQEKLFNSDNIFNQPIEHFDGVDLTNITSFEPHNALDGGYDGLDLIKKVIYKSNQLIKKNGMLAIEIGNKQYQKVSSILKLQGYREMSKEYDYKRNVRCIISTKVKFL